MFFKTAPEERFETVPVRILPTLIDFGAIFDFRDSQKVDGWNTFSVEKSPKGHEADGWERPLRDPAFR